MATRRGIKRGNFDSLNMDKKMNQFIDAGRQFVDGVSGTRPGKRRNSNFQDFSRRNVQNVGKWVSDKVDAFFEDEYESNWDDDTIYDEQDNFKTFSRHKLSGETRAMYKRPLQSISLRESSDFLDQDEEPRKMLRADNSSNDEWPDDSNFQVNKWQRPSEDAEYYRFEDSVENEEVVKPRNLPRSRRRRR
tara:strand:- start:3914 stop:4483 length:570 start_codon:yes stop_codon:yes gene_type:complete